MAHRLKIHIIVEKALAGTAACHTAPAQENQREMDAGAQLCPLLAQWEIPTHGDVLPTFTSINPIDMLPQTPRFVSPLILDLVKLTILTITNLIYVNFSKPKSEFSSGPSQKQFKWL